MKQIENIENDLTLCINLLDALLELADTHDSSRKIDLTTHGFCSIIESVRRHVVTIKQSTTSLAGALAPIEFHSAA